MRDTLRYFKDKGIIIDNAKSITDLILRHKNSSIFRVSPVKEFKDEVLDVRFKALHLTSFLEGSCYTFGLNIKLLKTESEKFAVIIKDHNYITILEKAVCKRYFEYTNDTPLTKQEEIKLLKNFK